MQNSTKKNIWFALAYAAVLAVGLMLGQNYAEESISIGNNSFIPLGTTDKTGKVQKALQLIQERYVDKVGLDTLQDVAIVEILSRLDPHSVYFSPRKARAMEENLSGSFDGIGIEYFSINDTLLVTNVVENGPAQKAGILRGDKLIWVNDSLIAGVNRSQEEISNLVRGKRGSLVNIWVSRDGKEIESPMKVKRDQIVVSSLDAAYIIQPRVAYIRIKRFGERTAEEFDATLKALGRNRFDKLILDLRGNGGGYFYAALAVADEFFPADKLLVYTAGANEKRTDYYSTDGGLYEKGQLIVLIDENSASSSEIVAGAIQDLKRGIIIGRRSFGKGLVQEQFDFGDGSALSLTVARYFTPTGRSIQKPYKFGNGQYFNELNQRFISGELTQEITRTDSVSADGRIYKSSSGKLFKVNGGIMPDIYIPMDTIALTPFYKEVVEKDLISKFVYNKLISSPPSFAVENFIEDYHLSPGTFKEFLEFLKSHDVNYSTQEVKLSSKQLEVDIKALMGRYFFGNEAWFKVRNHDDYMVQRSLEVLN
ncbi:S41 family peptidase [Albibacterium sp.]|uniref:S41 family peptidase n=1 Tax=Albibacterium sp. TaxID=2952885 RepID=UPI002D1D9E82|nr:S41 family peptidase [Albibacterium sp.]HUH20165.1 S41 family peptidase [Albibacterium sp.]